MNYNILNVDINIILETPHINSYIISMRKNLSQLMNIDYKPLITHKNFTYFDMPRYKYFLENIKFTKNYSNKGFNKRILLYQIGKNKISFEL